MHFSVISAGAFYCSSFNWWQLIEIDKQLCQTERSRWWWWSIAFCIPALRRGQGDSMTPSAPCYLPVTPDTAGAAIFSVPPAPLSKINVAEGGWMEEQWVQTQWLSSGMALCWHMINYLGEKRRTVCIHLARFDSLKLRQCRGSGIRNMIVTDNNTLLVLLSSPYSLFFLQFLNTIYIYL